MNKKTKRLLKNWCDVTRYTVESLYCLGAASDDEIRAAVVDFLINSAERIEDNITVGTITPPMR